MEPFFMPGPNPCLVNATRMIRIANVSHPL